MSRPRLLDLFCGAGGAAMGYWRAGFDVVGVDIRPQPHYPFKFIQEDALVFATWPDDGFSAIHASPPCQRFSALAALHPDDDHPDLIAPVRELLRASGLPYVIENVIGAPLINPVKLCGSSFGLRVRRHRLFECNWPAQGSVCNHVSQKNILVGVYGNSDGHVQTTKGYKRGPRQVTTIEAREVMGMPWAVERKGLTEAMPPAYTEHVGRQLIAQLQRG